MNKKSIVSKVDWKTIILTVFGVSLVAMVIAITVFFVKKNSLKYENNGGYYEIKYIKLKEYSDILNIYNNLPSGMTEEYLNQILEKGNIKADYVQINKDGGESYIADFQITPGMDFSDQNVEFISFNYLPGDGVTEVPSIEDVTFHSFHDGEHDFIQETSDEEFIHVSGDLTNSYDNKTFAIDSYLMTRY